MNNLQRRLAKLEEQILPVGDPKVIQIVFVSSDGTEEDGPRIEIPAYPAGRSPRR